MKDSRVGLIFGSLLGIALVTQGFADMLVVALLGCIGYLVARIVEGDLDIAEMLANRKARTPT